MPEISLLLPLCKELEISVNELLTGVKCLRDIGSGRLDSTHNLDDNLNLRVFQNLLPAVCKETAVHPLSLKCKFSPTRKGAAHQLVRSPISCIIIIPRNFLFLHILQQRSQFLFPTHSFQEPIYQLCLILKIWIRFHVAQNFLTV